MTPVRIALVAGAACTCLVGGTLAYATHEGSQPDPFAVAAAKCSLPVRQASHFGQSADVEDGVRVDDLGGGRYRVAGQVTGSLNHERRSASFVCEVAPDASDRLRGLKVTRLSVDDAG